MRTNSEIICTRPPFASPWIYVRNFSHPDGDLNITNKNCQAKSNYVTLGTVGAPEWLVLHLSLV